MARGRRKTLGWVLGAAAAGIGAGLAAERFLIGRARLRADPHSEIDYGRITAPRSYEVPSYDSSTLVAYESGAPRAPDGAVFLHGYSLDHTIWHHQIESLDDSRRYVYYDARYHGRSEPESPVDSPVTTEVLARDLEAVLRRSGLRRVVLVGHSMGGMTVLEFCRRFPQLLGDPVAGLILLNTTFTDALKTVVGAEVIGAVDRRLRRVVEGLLRDPRSSRAFRLKGGDLSWLLVRLFGFGPHASPAQVDHVRRLLAQFPSPPLIEIFRGLRDFDMTGALDAINIPTLIVAGGDDRITTVMASERMAEEIPGATLEVLEDTGHMVMMERHERFNELAGNFIDRVLVTPTTRREAAT